uniref:Uncharacterized protein n=1 Tax=Acanthochromis polyacanthus TaxID=80966 RepID=A0A3Q1F0V2_9TELE
MDKQIIQRLSLLNGSLKERDDHAEVWINVTGRFQVTELSCCMYAHLMHGGIEQKVRMKTRHFCGNSCDRIITFFWRVYIVQF